MAPNNIANNNRNCLIRPFHLSCCCLHQQWLSKISERVSSPCLLPEISETEARTFCKQNVLLSLTKMMLLQMTPPFLQLPTFSSHSWDSKRKREMECGSVEISGGFFLSDVRYFRGQSSAKGNYLRWPQRWPDCHLFLHKLIGRWPWGSTSDYPVGNILFVTNWAF